MIATHVLLIGLIAIVLGNRTFNINWEDDTFRKDGEPFRIYSGSMHYFRVPHQYWKDRMFKMKLAGLNTLQTYVAWNVHQPMVTDNHFEGDYDIERYLKLAQDMGLLVILRPGPYICAEWNFGGLPFWLLQKPGIEVRRYNKPYIDAIADWFSVLLPKITPFLYKNGGPIITVQIENEYGAYGPNVCDHKYLQFILNQYIKYFGSDTVYYTVDNTNVVRLACGGLPGLLKTLDFGPQKIPHFQFKMLRKYMPRGPLVNTEFWSGWFDRWGDQQHANVSAATVSHRLDQILQLNASFNLYMFEGGTNFGYNNGAMSKDGYKYNTRVTSYDYDSPLTEAGDTTIKYWAIRKIMKKYVEIPKDPVPPHAPKWKSDPIPLNYVSSVFDNLHIYSSCVKNKLPVFMEAFNQSQGFILYKLNWSKIISNITLYNVHDRAMVYINNELIGVIDRRKEANGTINIPSQMIHKPENKQETEIKILVENMGRVNRGSFMVEDVKGISDRVLIDGINVNHEDWTVCPLPLSAPPQNTKKLSRLHTVDTQKPFTPTFYCGNFLSSNSYDTFLDPRSWTKGVAFFNGINIGRYWPKTGPQITLYTPGVYFNNGNNRLCVLELEAVAPSKIEMRFIDRAILGSSDNSAF